jgi:hypothetical protein
MDALTSTRQLLHGVAEGLLAGPQHRTCAQIRLRVTPGGFATIGAPPLRVDGQELVVDEQRRVPLAGSLVAVGAATGHGYGPPVGVYGDLSGVGGSELLRLDPDAVALLTSWFVRADAALRVLAPRETPVLWPEHFDVAVTLDGATYGASPGDASCPTPYAYVSVTPPSPDDYWNAPFGAQRAFSTVPGVDELVGYWQAGRSLLAAEA